MITDNGQGHQCLCYSGNRSAWKPSLADARRNINSSRCLKCHTKQIFDVFSDEDGYTMYNVHCTCT